MARFPQVPDGYGSLKDIQVLVNEKSELLGRALSNRFGVTEEIEWKSPLRNDDFAEYRDEDFLSLLGIGERLKTPLKDFWPPRGPQWDALGRTKDTVFLVEAKANIPELRSPPTKASQKARDKIISALDKTKRYMGIDDSFRWEAAYYQYANRIAHLHFLKTINGIDARLVFVYFIGDSSVRGPASENEWRKAIGEAKMKLGIPERHI